MVRERVMVVGSAPLLINPSATRYPVAGDCTEGWYSILQPVAKKPIKKMLVIDLIILIFCKWLHDIF
jgi:hypothetical protein